VWICLTRFVTLALHLQVFDEYDEEVQAAEEAELSQGQPDSEKDIRPTHAKHGKGRAESGMAGAADGEGKWQMTCESII
jgi:hypothetical protein